MQMPFKPNKALCYQNWAVSMTIPLLGVYCADVPADKIHNQNVQ